MREIAREVIEKAAGGDMAAFEEIYKTFSSTVYTIAFNITRSRQDAEEATQDVFVKIFRKLADFNFESSFGTWLYRIATNTAINIYKSRSRHRQKAVSIEEAGDPVDSAGWNAQRGAIDRESAELKVAALLGQLNPEMRSCITLRELEGLDYKEIARVLRIPLNTVRSRIRRAREALVEHCKKEVGHGL